MDAGIPEEHKRLTVYFRYKDLASVQELLDRHDRQVACILEAATATAEPAPCFLTGLRAFG